VITATIAAYFVEQKAEEDLASRLDQIMERLDRIEVGLRPGEDQHALEHLHRGTAGLGGAVSRVAAGAGIDDSVATD
jgi:hypothetical protein